MEFWVEEELSVERTIGEQHRDARSWCPRKDVGPAICIDHLQRTDSDERLEHMRQGKHSRLSISPRPCPQRIALPLASIHIMLNILCLPSASCGCRFRLGRLMRDQDDLHPTLLIPFSNSSVGSAMRDI